MSLVGNFGVNKCRLKSILLLYCSSVDQFNMSRFGVVLSPMFASRVAESLKTFWGSSTNFTTIMLSRIWLGVWGLD